jgi:hypothetical protein
MRLRDADTGSILAMLGDGWQVERPVDCHGHMLLLLDREVAGDDRPTVVLEDTITGIGAAIVNEDSWRKIGDFKDLPAALQHVRSLEWV